jgi:type II secretory pathway component PulJ
MRALRRQDGFTLPELLIMLSMSLIVALAAFSLLDVTMRKTGEATARVQSAQSGRLAMDIMTRELRSQVCLDTDPATPPMAAPTGFGQLSDSNDAVFYTDFTDPGTAVPLPELHVLSYDSTKNQLLEKDYVGNVVTSTAADGSVVNTYTYPSANTTPARTKVLLGNVVPYPNYTAGSPSTSSPVFTYYAYSSTSNPPRPDKLLSATSGLSAADAAVVARIDISFRTLGDTAKAGQLGSTVYQDSVYVREADPNDDAPTPTCA